MTEELQQLTRLGALLRDSQQSTTDLEAERNALIRSLARQGFALSGLAVAAGVSRQRVHQIASTGRVGR